MTTKGKETIKAGWKPGEGSGRDLSGLKRLVAARKPSFRSARRGFYVPPEDCAACVMAAADYQKEHPEVEHHEAVTLAYRCYWQLWEER